MSLSGMPPAFSVSITLVIAAVLAESASAAVAPCVVTPALTVTVSGACLTSPCPVSVITRGNLVSSARAGAALSDAAASGSPMAVRASVRRSMMSPVVSELLWTEIAACVCSLCGTQRKGGSSKLRNLREWSWAMLPRNCSMVSSPIIRCSPTARS